MAHSAHDFIKVKICSNVNASAAELPSAMTSPDLLLSRDFFLQLIFISGLQEST